MAKRNETFPRSHSVITQRCTVQTPPHTDVDIAFMNNRTHSRTVSGYKSKHS